MKGREGARSTTDPHAASCPTRCEGAVVVSCHRHLDVSGHAALRDALAEVKDMAPDRIVLDLSQVDSFDAGDRAGLARTGSALGALTGRLEVRSPTVAGVRWLLALGLDHLRQAPSAGARTDATTGAGASAARESLAPDVGLLADAWTRACKNHPRLGSEPMFVDPPVIVARIVGLLDDPSRAVGPSAADWLASSNGSGASTTTTTTAVAQLLALWRVLQTWIGWGSEDRHLRQERLAQVMDVAVEAVVSDALGDLETVARIDPLTGLLNRRALDAHLLQALGAARRHRRALTVVVLDMDGLKAINDRNGHEAGDAALQELAINLTSGIRIGDNAFRIGGDEFLLLLPDLRPEDVGAVVDRIVVSERGTFTWGSAGVSADARSEVPTPASLIALADQRMIDHRNRHRPGRDQIAPLLAEPPTEGRSTSGSVRLLGQISLGTNSHIVIEQAKGIVAEHFGLEIDDVEGVLRDYSERSHWPVHRVAEGIVDRSLKADELVPVIPPGEQMAPEPSVIPLHGDTT